jgi:hypothetical protein
MYNVYFSDMFTITKIRVAIFHSQIALDLSNVLHNHTRDDSVFVHNCYLFVLLESERLRL